MAGTTGIAPCSRVRIGSMKRSPKAASSPLITMRSGSSVQARLATAMLRIVTVSSTTCAATRSPPRAACSTLSALKKSGWPFGPGPSTDAPPAASASRARCTMPSVPASPSRQP